MHYFIIAIITTIFWHPILAQTFLGESYYYFDAKWSLIHSPKPLYLIPVYYDNFARLFFDLTIPILKDNIFAYMVLQLLLMITLNCIFYFCLKKITESKPIALFSTIYFLTNYMYSFDLWGIANYARITQRIPNLIPHLFAFLALVKHFYSLKKSKKTTFSKNLKLSYLLFTLALFMGHYSSFFSPVFWVFPIAFAFLKNKKLLKHAFFVSISFAIYNFILISFDPHTHDRDIGGLFRRDSLWGEMLVQVSHLIFPPKLFEMLGFDYPYTDISAVFGFLGILLLVGGYFYVNKIKPKSKLAIIYLGFLGTLPIMLAFNLLGDRTFPLTHAGSDRYYFIPGMLTATLISILFLTIFGQKKYLKPILVVIASFYLVQNFKTIRKNFDENYYKTQILNAYLMHLKDVDFSDDVVIAAPTDYIWPNQRIERLYAKGSFRFVDSENANWEDEIQAEEWSHTYVIDYSTTPVGIEPFEVTILDKTKEFREKYQAETT